MEYFIVNSFTNQAFQGNPAGVVVVDDFPAEHIMQNVAKQLNLVETVFIKVNNSNENKFHFKYFTPLCEIPIAGHPTIAGLKVLNEMKLISEHKTIVKTSKKEIVAYTNKSNSSSIYSIAFDKIISRHIINNRLKVALTLNLDESDIMSSFPIQVIDSGLGHIIVPVNSLKALHKIQRNISELAELCKANQAREVQAFTFETIHQENQLHTRNICPREGIEDPACGVGNAALLAYLALNNYNFQHINIEQGYINDFKSLIKGMIIKKDCVLIGGNARIMSRGMIYL